MKRIKALGILIAAVMAIMMAVTACGGSQQGGNGASDISGTYKAQMDMSQMLDESLAASGITIDEAINIDMILELKSSGEFDLSVDAEQMVNTIMDFLKNSGGDLIKSTLLGQGLSEEEFDSIASAAGYDSMDKMIEELLVQLEDQLKESYESSASEMHATGKYTVEGEKINLTGDNENFSIKDGTINSDGSIALKVNMTDTETELVFRK